ncbi:GntR family transcriptional regulator [Bauldia sp.]|uniref:GntR family transcriptional regulator n=1 Tax=Bauldia sp. TaxID=2575872 RepID=UPI003BAD267E
MADTAKTTRVDNAYERLKAEILMNRMPPGFQAPEPEIAVRLGMSRTPVREALIRLEADGLVELIPRRGARVLPVYADDMRDIYEILTALEPEAAAQLAQRNLDRDAIGELEAATADMEHALAHNDLDAWAEADDRFHRKLLRLHGNRRMTGFAETLFGQVHRARMITLRLRQPPVRSTQEHREILENILAGDSEQARATYRRHRQRANRELMAILEDYRLPQL